MRTNWTGAERIKGQTLPPTEQIKALRGMGIREALNYRREAVEGTIDAIARIEAEHPELTAQADEAITEIRDAWAAGR